jgi:hypothetical protein
MSEMICARCHRYGIYWVGLCGLSLYTICPHCGGINCQILPEPEPEEDAGEDEEVKP